MIACLALGLVPAASYAAPTSVTDTSAADFGAGTTAGTYVSNVGDGEVTLMPTVGEEFSGGPGLPSGWETGTWTAGGTATVSGGELHVDGAYAATTATYGSGHVLEFKASFGGGNFSHVGFGVDLNNNPNWAIFSIKGDGLFYARTNVDGTSTETQLPSSLIGSPHVYRIEWDAAQVRYYVDGSLVATHAAAFTTAMRPIASDFTAGGPDVSVDWLHVSPYQTSGTFDSRVFDAGSPVTWGTLSWTADTPGGTGVSLSVRTGNTPTPDASWSVFSPVSSSGATIGAHARYLQSRAALSTSDPSQTPILSDVTATYVNPAAYTGAVLADHPLGYWRLGDALDTAVMSDATGQYPGTYVNGAGGSPQLGISGDGDTAAYFIGNDQYGYVNGLQAPQQAYSLEAWVLPSKAAAGMVLQQGAAGALYIDSQGRYTFVPDSNDVQNLLVDDVPADAVPAGGSGRFHHVVGTWDGSTAILYVDGREVASGASTQAPSGAATFYIGYGTLGPWFSGYIDEVAYYDHALAPDRVLAHYLADPPPPLLHPEQLVRSGGTVAGPRLMLLGVAPSAFKAARTGPSALARGKSGAPVRFRLNEAATVTFTVQSSRNAAAARWVAVKGRFAWTGAAGANALRFTGRIGGSALAPGTYRLIATARDRSGHLAHPVSVTFTISR